MIRFILSRLLAVVPSMLGLVLLTFVMLHAVPADPVAALAGDNATPQQIAELRARFGLDRPLAEQFLIYLGQILRGDLGNSIFSNRPVVNEVFERLPATLELLTAALVLAVVLGVPAGVTAAVRHRSAYDQTIRAFTICGLAVATFWVAILFQLTFSMELGWFPLRGRLDVGLPSPPRLTGILLIDSVLAGDGSTFVSALRHLAIPATTLAIPAIATIARFTRSGVLETLGKDFVTYAEAVGYLPRRLIWIYILKNSIAAVITQVGLLFGALIGGAVVVETIFDWPGLGSYAINAILNFDYKAVLGVTLVIGLIYAVVNILVDLLHAAIDPRLREVR